MVYQRRGHVDAFRTDALLVPAARQHWSVARRRLPVRFGQARLGIAGDQRISKPKLGFSRRLIVSLTVASRFGFLSTELSRSLPVARNCGQNCGQTVSSAQSVESSSASGAATMSASFPEAGQRRKAGGRGDREKGRPRISLGGPHIYSASRGATLNAAGGGCLLLTTVAPARRSDLSQWPDGRGGDECPSEISSAAEP